MHRRRVLKGIVALGAIATWPSLLWAKRPDAAFDSDNADKAIAAVYGQTALASDRIKMKIPDIAENGAVVPVTVSTDLDDVESISIVVINNPTPFVASFDMGPRMLPAISVLIKMGETSQVLALFKAGGNHYSTSKEVKFTIRGCGG